MSECLYLFLDEGGNLDFSPTGTPWFTLTSVTMTRPLPMLHEWSEAKHDYLEYGLNTEYFHCTDDNQYIRNRLFGLIGNHLDQLRIDSLIVEKAKTGPALREDNRFYPEMLGYLLRYVFEQENLSQYREVIVITDQIPHQKKRKAVEKGIKHTLKAMLPEGSRFRVLHHASRSHHGLQVADYCNWAIYRKWQMGEHDYFGQIAGGVRSEFEIFRNGTRRYY